MTQPDDASGCEVYRIIPRVSDNPFMALTNPYIRLGVCVRCAKPVWRTDDDLPEWMLPLCVWCGLDDPDLHDIVKRMLGSIAEPEAEAEGGAEAGAALHRHLEGLLRGVL